MKHLVRLFLIVLSVAFLAMASPLEARRTSKDVKREKQRTAKQIQQTKRQIEKNDRATSRQLQRLESVRAEIALRNDTIERLRVSLDSIRGAIEVVNDSIARLEAREKALKQSYARTLRTIRERRQSMGDLQFVFSAGSFGEAWRRIRYLRQIAESTTKQARMVAAARVKVDEARARLKELNDSQSAALARQNAVQASLRTEMASADNLVKNLKKQGKSLQRELERRNSQARRLDSELDKIVEQERREAEERRRREAAEAERRRREEEEARNRAEQQRAKEEQARREAERRRETGQPEAAPSSSPAQSKTKPSAPAKPAAPQAPAAAPQKKPTEFVSEAEADRRLTGSFAANKGRLLFPVAGKYTVVSNFGTNELPELSKVKVDNLGIDIEVPRGAGARAVFEGVVSSIFRLDGYNNIVIVRHGEYLSVYAGIETLSVKKGDKVKAGQQLGSVAPTNVDDRARLHFEIRHEKQKLNPAEWVK